jgi:hypothetical protein
MIVFYKDIYPVKMVHLRGTSHYFFKLRHLIEVFKQPFTKVRQTVPASFTLYFSELRELFPLCDESLYPTTLLVSLKGLHYFAQCLNERDQQSLHRFVEDSLALRSNKELSADYEIIPRVEDERRSRSLSRSSSPSDPPEECVVGVLKQNIEFIKLKQSKKCYFKAFDVAKAISCAPSYSVNKFVSDDNMVVWKDLRRYLEHKCRCAIENRWKEQTVFLKHAGLKQLLLMRKQKVLYAKINLGAAQLEEGQECPEYVKQPNRYRKKRLYAEGCVVGKLFGTIDYIMTPDGTVWSKFSAVQRHFGLKRVDSLDYAQHITTWLQLEKMLRSRKLTTNIKWKDRVVLMDGVGVYKMLKNFGLNSEAEELYFHNLHSIKFEGKT